LFAATLNIIQSSKINSTLGLILVNGTTPNCELNGTNVTVNLCLDLASKYQCVRGDAINISLDCTMMDDYSNCHEIFASDENLNNVTFDCFYLYANKSQQPQLGEDECIYGVDLGDEHTNFNETEIICMTYVPVVQTTMFNTTELIFNLTSPIFNTTERINKTASSNCIQVITKYYTLFGMEVNKKFMKTYGICILVAIIVVTCLLTLCCFGMCSFCCRKMTCPCKWKKENNQRMPQSSNAYNI